MEKNREISPEELKNEGWIKLWFSYGGIDQPWQVWKKESKYLFYSAERKIIVCGEEHFFSSQSNKTVATQC
jgi:hypothetical protein